MTPNYHHPSSRICSKLVGGLGSGTECSCRRPCRTGRLLLPNLRAETAVQTARRLYAAPFVVPAHDDQPDPRFTYANLAAQQLFERSWDEVIGLISRLSAAAPARGERERLLARVATHGFIDDCCGVRIAKSGRRFTILRATVWNVSDASGRRIGQAASFSD